MTAREWEYEHLNAKLGSIPGLCPACASLQVVRVIWQSDSYGGPIKSIVDAGKAVLAGKEKPLNVPAWACLDCQPGWLTVHQLSLEENVLQLKKENALVIEDFESAMHYRDLQEPIRQRRRKLLSILV